MNIRCEIEIGRLDEDFRLVVGNIPAVWTGNAAKFQILLRRGGVIANDDVDTYDFIKLTILAESRTGAPFATQTVASADLDTSLTEETWADGTKQHVEFSFDPAELELSIDEGALSKKYWLVISAGTVADALAPGTLGGSDILFHRDGIPEDPTYVQAGNIVTGGAEYDGSGEYELNVTAGRWYRWTDGGANDTSVTNGAQTVTVNNTVFLTEGATITLNGVAGQPVTAVIYPNPVIFADEIAAFIASLIGEAEGGVSFTQNIGNGVDIVTVDYTSLGLLATPESIVPTIIKPAVGAKIYCNLIDGTATATECQVELSALTELTTYKVRLHIIP